MRNLLYAYKNNKAAPVHPHSLISTFVVRCWDSILPVVSIAGQTGFCLTVQTERQVFLWCRSWRGETDSLITAVQLHIVGTLVPSYFTWYRFSAGEWFSNTEFHNTVSHCKPHILYANDMQCSVRIINTILLITIRLCKLIIVVIYLFSSL